MKEMNRNLFYNTAEYENRCLNVLSVVLKTYKIPSEYYYIGGYAEESICIEKENKEWLLYLGERGAKKFQKKNQDIYKICIDAIAELADSNEQERRMKMLFAQMVRSESRLSKRRRFSIEIRRNSLFEENSGIRGQKEAPYEKQTSQKRKKSGFQ